jgi:hypothetical protein
MGVVNLEMSSDVSEHAKSAELSLKNELAGSSSPYVSHVRVIQRKTHPLTCLVTISCEYSSGFPGMEPRNPVVSEEVGPPHLSQHRLLCMPL